MGDAMVGFPRSLRVQALVLAALFLLPAFSLTSEGAELNAPIVVEGNDGFVAAGFTGSGTSGDPYVLSDVKVVLTEATYHHGISISNTTKHFIIIDCQVSNAMTSETDSLDPQRSGSGILLCNVSNGTVQDTMADYNARGITLYRCTDVSLINCTLDNNYRAGVYVVDCPDSNISISECDVIASDDYPDIDLGILLQDSSYVNLSSNQITFASEAGISLGSNSVPCREINIQGNTISGLAGDGIVLEGSMVAQNNIVQGNIISHITRAGLLISSGTFNEVDGNLFTGCGYAIRLMALADSNLFTGNTMVNGTYGARLEAGADSNTFDGNYVQNGAFGIYISTSSGNTVRNCSLTDMSTAGVSVGTEDVLNTTIGSNQMLRCGWGIRAVAISGYEIEGLTVIGNNITDPTIGGLYMMRTVDSLVLNNSFRNATGDGFHLGTSCDRNTLKGNLFMANQKHGLTIFNAYDNIITGNLFKVNALEGIYLDGGSGNTISGNVLQYNNGTTDDQVGGHPQAYCANDDNVWYSGTGNCWSDLTSPDANEDGIVDMPYVIGPSGIDLYPLVSIISPLKDVQAIGLWHSVQLNWTLPEHTLINGLEEVMVARDDGPVWALDSDAEGLLDDTTSPNTVYGYTIMVTNGLADVTAHINVTTPDVSSLLVITAPQEGQILRYEESTLTWEVNGISVSHYSVSLDNGSFINVGTERQYIMDLLDGGHSATVRAHFANSSYLDASVSFTVSGYPPSLAVITPMKGSRLNGETVISWYGTNGSSQIANFYISVDGQGWSALGLVYGLSLNLSEGDHVIRLKAVDSSGRESALVSVNVTVDLTAPTVTAFSPQGSDVANGSDITITFSEAMKASSVVVKVNDVTVAGVWENLTYVLSTELDYGTAYVIVANGEDLAGNALAEHEWSFTTEMGNATVSGRLVDEDGNALSGAAIICGDATASSDADGNFSMMLSPGNSTLVIRMEGYQDQEVTVTMAPGQDQYIGEITLERSDGTTMYIVIVIAAAAACVLGIWLWRRKR